METIYKYKKQIAIITVAVLIGILIGVMLAKIPNGDVKGYYIASFKDGDTRVLTLSNNGTGTWYGYEGTYKIKNGTIEFYYKDKTSHYSSETDSIEYVETDQTKTFKIVEGGLLDSYNFYEKQK